MAQRRIGRDAGTEKWSGAGGIQIVRNTQDKASSTTMLSE